jgi:quinolinate synthase
MSPKSKTMDNKEIIKKIKELKKKHNVVILVHNYQRPEIYEIADYIGDSLELSRKASETKADIILFCGVQFMAETAKILSPEKIVILPNLDAGCSLADMANVEDLVKLKEKYPKAAVVSYVNTSAEIKALSDVCCTSMNALKIINSLPNNQIIFLPDKNLANYVAKNTNKEIIIWKGYCFVHNDLKKEYVDEMKERFPNSKIIAHPECKQEILNISDCITGTGGMAKFALQDNAKDFIIATECGMTEKLKQDIPDKNFHSFCNICPYMKCTTLPLILNSLKEMKHQIEIPEEIRIKAKKAIDKMLEIK